MIRVLLALHRIGPYHHARFRAVVAADFNIHILETRPASEEYPWSFDSAGDYPIHYLRGQLSPEQDPSVAALDHQLAALLDRLHPQVVISVGWADRAYQRLLLAAQQRQIPMVIVSDSRERDAPRSRFKESIKRQLLLGYSSALVAGTESRIYLKKLGFPASAIFQPWDVVDNTFFSEAAVQQPIQITAAIPAGPHFLCVGRFIWEKNHVGLIAAYGNYQRQGGGWGLRLIGSGPLLAEIEHAIATLPRPGSVNLLPFQQLVKLPTIYAQASVLLLASVKDTWGLVVNEAMAADLPCLVSSACGCAADLIEHGRTGWCFDPASPEQLTALMHGCERQSPADRAAMVLAASRRLEVFSPATFATGLRQAVEWALAHRRRSRRAALTAQLLSYRP